MHFMMQIMIIRILKFFEEVVVHISNNNFVVMGYQK